MATSGVPVHTGLWINWSHAPIYGATITLSSRDGAFLVAFLALYVGLAGGQFWKIVSFILHQIRATKRWQSDDAMFHQQQAILKNVGSPFDVAKELFELSWAWRKSTSRPFFRAFLLSAYALLVLSGFYVAGIFSSEVTTAVSSDVLVRSSDCGAWEYFGPESASQNSYQFKVLNETLNAAQYVRNCYWNSQDTFGCNIYVTDQIPWKTTLNATCPFREEVCHACPFSNGTCVGSNAAALHLDTGPLDSHEIFGLDAPKTRRITYRKVTSCAPIAVDNWGKLESRNVTIDGIVSQDPVLNYYCGPFLGAQDYTYQWPLHTAVDNVGYQLQSYIAWGGSMYSNQPDAWQPVSQLNRSDADVSIIFLAQNTAAYTTPVNDPFFSAHSQHTYPMGGYNGTIYSSDHPVTALGCVDQHQICNPNYPGFNGDSIGCTPLTFANALFDDAQTIGFSDYQLAVANRFLQYLTFSGAIGDAIYFRGASALRANELQVALTSPGLPDNQWVIEVSNWFALLLVQLQAYVVEYAVGPSHLGHLGTVLKFNFSSEKTVCDSQMVHSVDGYQNFSVLGVSLIIALGAVIIITGFVIDKVVGWFQIRIKKGGYGRLSWQLDDKLQLQRMAYEGAGWGQWRNCNKSVPIKEGVADLGQYTNEIAHHPSIFQFVGQSVDSGGVNGVQNGLPHGQDIDQAKERSSNGSGST